MSVTISVSPAMLPVVTAATSAAAMSALGISPAMQQVVGAPTLSGARSAFGGPEINISWFGAALDNVTDDSAAWIAAIADGRPIFHPGGTSVVTGNLALGDTTTIRGVSGFRATPGKPLTQTSMIRFVGNNAGVTVQDATGGGFTLEKIGFVGDAVKYTGQIGLLLSDTLRPSGLNEGWPTLRDVLFNGFSTGCLVGNTYQTGYMHNVFFQNSTQIGYQNKSTDWYHYGVYGGNGSNVASVAQLILGSTSGVMTYSAGYHQFHGGAWFGGNNTVIIANTSGNKFIGCDIQNGNQNGVLLTGTYANDNRFTSCYFSGNNGAGGSRNVKGLSFYDVYIRNGYRAFLAGLASPLDARLAAVSSSGSTGQRPSSRPDLPYAPPARAVTVQDGHRPSRSDAQRPGGSRARWHTDADRDEREGYGREYGIGFGAWSDAAVATGQSAPGDRQAAARITLGGCRRPRQPVSLPGLRQAL